MSEAHSKAVEEVLRAMEAAYRMQAGRDRDEVIRVFGEAMEELETVVLRETWTHLRRTYSNRIFPQLGDWIAAVEQVRKNHPRKDLESCKVGREEAIFPILLAYRAGRHSVDDMLREGPVSMRLAGESLTAEAGQVARAKKDLALLAESGEWVGEGSGAWFALLDGLKARLADPHASLPKAARDGGDAGGRASHGAGGQGETGWWFSGEQACAARALHGEWLAGRAAPAMLPAWLRRCWDPDHAKGQDAARSLGSAQDRAGEKERSEDAA